MSIFLFILDHTYEGTIENRAFPSLYGESLEITLTVPLNV